MNNLVPAPLCVLAMVAASGEIWSEELHVKKIVFSDGTKNIVNYALGTGPQEVAEFRSVSACEV